MAKPKAVTAEVSKGRNRAPIRITKKNYHMTSKVVGVSPRLNGSSFKDEDGVDTHCLDWRHLLRPLSNQRATLPFTWAN
jgi:hypothetical protein